MTKSYQKNRVNLLQRPQDTYVENKNRADFCNSQLWRFFDAYYQVYSSLAGERTKDVIEIKSISAHFIYWPFGTLLDPKIYEKEHWINWISGPEVENLIVTVKNAVSRPTTYDEYKNPSKMYTGDNCKATITPKTGILLQCNPYFKNKW